MTGLHRTVVATTMSRLKRTGELEPHGRGPRGARANRQDEGAAGRLKYAARGLQLTAAIAGGVLAVGLLAGFGLRRVLRNE
jgi:hypothetical protein